MANTKQLRRFSPRLWESDKNGEVFGIWDQQNQQWLRHQGDMILAANIDNAKKIAHGADNLNVPANNPPVMPWDEGSRRMTRIRETAAKEKEIFFSKTKPKARPDGAAFAVAEAEAKGSSLAYDRDIVHYGCHRETSMANNLHIWLPCRGEE